MNGTDEHEVNVISLEILAKKVLQVIITSLYIIYYVLEIKYVEASRSSYIIITIIIKTCLVDFLCFCKFSFYSVFGVSFVNLSYAVC